MLVPSLDTESIWFFGTDSTKVLILDVTALCISALSTFRLDHQNTWLHGAGKNSTTAFLCQQSQGSWASWSPNCSQGMELRALDSTENTCLKKALSAVGVVTGAEWAEGLIASCLKERASPEGYFPWSERDHLMYAEVIDLAALGEILQIWSEREAK